MSVATSKLAKLVEKYYDIGQVVSVEPIKSGVTNENFTVVTDGGKFVLRIVARSTAINQVKNMIPLMAHLKSINYPVAGIVESKKHKTYTKRFGKTYILMTHEAGEQGMPETINTDRLESFAAALAKLHEVQWTFHHRSETLEPDYFLKMYRSYTPRVAKKVFSGQAEFTELMEAEYQVITKELSSVLSNLPKGIVHDDPIPWNVLFVGNKVSAMVDFEAVGESAFLFDLARAINLWCFDEDQEKLNPNRLRTFISAYNAKRQLTDEEYKCLPFMLKTVAFRHAVYHMRMFIQKRHHNPADSIDFKCLRYYQKTNVSQMLTRLTN